MRTTKKELENKVKNLERWSDVRTKELLRLQTLVEKKTRALAQHKFNWFIYGFSLGASSMFLLYMVI